MIPVKNQINDIIADQYYIDDVIADQCYNDDITNILGLFWYFVSY